LIEHNRHSKEKVESYLNEFGVADENIEAIAHPLLDLLISAFTVSCPEDLDLVSFVLNEFG
jgi:hypothetical protein